MPVRLGDLERVVLSHVWDSGDDGATVREIHDRMTDRALAYTTVMTILERLTKKGMLSRNREGRAWRYLATETREGLAARVMRESLDSLAGADAHGAMLGFLSRSTPDEVAAIRAALDDFDKRSSES